MSLKCLLTGFLLCLAGSIPALAQGESAPEPAESAPAATPIVVELFTTQTCPMCPPADAFLVDLSQDPDVLALSFLVELWDFMGWEDPLASPENSKRHKTYNKMLHQRGVFTPQIILNGQVSRAGSRRESVRAAVAQFKAGKTRTVPVRTSLIDNNSALRITIPATVPPATAAPATADQAGNETASTGRPCAVYLAAFRTYRDLKIAGGRNEGRMVTYTNAVFDFAHIADWDGTSALDVTASIPDDDMGPAEGLAVLVQDGTVGPIVGASAVYLAAADNTPPSH